MSTRITRGTMAGRAAFPVGSQCTLSSRPVRHGSRRLSSHVDEHSTTSPSVRRCRLVDDGPDLRPDEDTGRHGLQVVASRLSVLAAGCREAAQRRLAPRTPTADAPVVTLRRCPTWSSTTAGEAGSTGSLNDVTHRRNCWPDRRRSSFSACSIMCSAMRSFTDTKGF